MSALVRCEHCVFWQWTEAHGTVGGPSQPFRGRCRRRAPLPAIGVGDDEARWPRTYVTDSCGEGVEKPAWEQEEPDEAPSPPPNVRQPVGGYQCITPGCGFVSSDWREARRHHETMRHTISARFP